MGQIVLQTEGLSKAYGGLRAVDGVDLQVEEGERRVVIGPNGAGKTTLFRLLSGEVRPTRGRVLWRGRDVTHLPAHRRTALGIGRTYQVTNVFLHLSVLENALLGVWGLRREQYDPFRPALSHRESRRRAQELLETFGLWEKRDWPAASLSYGEQRQLEIVLALAGNPRLLLLDEPTAGLSPGETQQVVALLRSLDPRITVLLIEHDMDVAFSIAQRITVMHLGRILAEGTVEEIRRNPEVQAIYLGEEG
ncbi:MAG: ABC transporter ATP-binding protein [Armatimonadota bacterium]|nr:ABC transporter ATP-binding protein [Armatimonadota bacterium]MDR7439074.1 ABC transporter ATP-binding protein [Armatimonadota bacterium]MDR7562989.1 ABC transporter ATP-binding protein [Armatimonadota bacterium]MDR7568812.1 ABC transporter ATP-binding protein [Armatimonadota bacterium]MDR7600833.1 ABC transporter ATP-binding protein [Armatimonadota bacterium]